MAVLGFLILQVLAMLACRVHGQECFAAHDFQEWGPHQIGRRVYSIQVAPLFASRVLDTTVFYPTSASFAKGDDLPVGDLLMAALGDSVSPFERSLLSVAASTFTIPARSKLNVEISEAHGRSYPLVFWVHGDQSSHHLSNAYLEHIASHGFVVIASDHPGVSFASPGGLPFGPENAILHDVSQLLGLLEGSTDGSDGIGYDFGKHVNTSSYALVGHSRGGLAAFLAGSRGGKVKLSAGLMIAPHWYGRDLLADYESYLQVGGTADTRYNTGDCLSYAREANASNFKSMLMIKDAPHDVPVMLDTCPFLARPYLRPFKRYLEQIPSFTEASDACKTENGRLSGWAGVVKTATVLALMRAFDNSDCALSTLGRMKQEFPKVVTESYTNGLPSIRSARFALALAEQASSFGANRDLDFILNRSDLILLVFGMIIIVVSAFVLVLFHAFMNDQICKRWRCQTAKCDFYNPLLGCNEGTRDSMMGMAV